ncbi:hypothetical protein C8R45DRAFT_633633 [Mycena sanguinolenta]|nr:hypothetical protein C8R45DRAFT_633633 [Mycena sanguinolenta]
MTPTASFIFETHGGAPVFHIPLLVSTVPEHVGLIFRNHGGTPTFNIGSANAGVASSAATKARHATEARRAGETEKTPVVPGTGKKQETQKIVADAQAGQGRIFGIQPKIKTADLPDAPPAPFPRRYGIRVVLRPTRDNAKQSASEPLHAPRVAPATVDTTPTHHQAPNTGAKPLPRTFRDLMREINRPARPSNNEEHTKRYPDEETEGNTSPLANLELLKSHGTTSGTRTGNKRPREERDNGPDIGVSAKRARKESGSGSRNAPTNVQTADTDDAPLLVETEGRYSPVHPASRMRG